MPASSWIAHVKGVYAKGKSKGMSYKDAPSRREDLEEGR